MPEFNQKFNRETLTAAEREAHPAFKRLAGEMQQFSFVGYWIDSGGDQFFAHAQAYSSPDAETSRKSSYDVMQRKAVKNAIDVFLCKSEKEKFLEELAGACRSRKITPTKLRLFELRAATEFGVDLKSLRAEAVKSKRKESEAVPAETKRYKVGDVIDYDGKKVRVTKIDENGQAVEGDPVVASPEAW